MPPLAIAGVAAVATAGASILSSRSNSRAINRATEAQQESNAEQIAFQREAYARNTANLTPWMNRGNQAGDTIMAALGLGGTATVPQANQPPQGALTVPYSGAYPDASGYPGYSPGALNSYNPAQFRMQALDAYPMNDMPFAPQPQNTAPQQQTAQAGSNPQTAALNAYELFKNSMGYQTRLQEGQRGQAAMYGALGAYQSGARDKALARFNQNFASNEFGNWLGALGNQQQYGFAGASALAGVSQGSADRMGAISQNSADFAGQAAVARAQNQGALFTGIAGAAGNIAGALSSYRPRVYA